MKNKKTTTSSGNDLIEILGKRFLQYPARHKGIDWDKVKQRLLKQPKQLQVLERMEETGGEPDVVGYDKTKDQYIFFDCSAESPTGRRSLCYDGPALRSRKEHKPAGNAIDRAAEMGISLLTEEEYRYLQKLGAFDLKTSSWIQTPDTIRERGGALFCDRRYDTVFLYHNGAESYYAARGFRGVLRV